MMFSLFGRPERPSLTDLDDTHHVRESITDILSRASINYSPEEQFIMAERTDHKQVLIEELTKKEITLDTRRGVLEEVLQRAQTELADVQSALKVTRDAIHTLNRGEVKETVKASTDDAEDRRNSIRNAAASNSPV